MPRKLFVALEAAAPRQIGVTIEMIDIFEFQTNSR